MSSLRLTTSLQQRMILTPQLRQRIEMLQMTSMELNELIEQELVANPILEEVLPGDEVQEISENILDQNANGVDESYSNGTEPTTLSDSPVEFMDTAESYVAEAPGENGAEPPSLDSISSEDTPPEQNDSFDEIDYGREFQDYLDPGYRTQEIEYKDDAPSFEQFLSHSITLSEHLEWQLNMLDVDSAIKNAALNVIGNLDDDGRLVTSVEEIASASLCSIDTAEKARQAVLTFDPVGCGALDVKECLLAQLAVNGEKDSLASQLVAEHLEDLLPHRLQHLSKATGVDIHTLDDEIKK